jgi:hypothetical protein
MPEALCFDDLSLGNFAKIQRVCWRLTPQEMAGKAGVPQRVITSFEDNQHLPLITKLKLLRAYDLIVESNDIPVHS